MNANVHVNFESAKLLPEKIGKRNAERCGIRRVSLKNGIEFPCGLHFFRKKHCRIKNIFVPLPSVVKNDWK